LAKAGERLKIGKRRVRFSKLNPDGLRMQSYPRPSFYDFQRTRWARCAPGMNDSACRAIFCGQKRELGSWTQGERCAVEVESGYSLSLMPETSKNVPVC